MLKPRGVRTQAEQHPVTGAVGEDGKRRRQHRHRSCLEGISPARRRVALAVAQRVHGRKVPVTDARLGDAAVRVQLV